MISHDSILSRLAELRATAEAAMTVGDNDPWSVLYDSHVVARVNGKPTYYSIAKELHTEHAVHIATWDPAATLRWLSWAEQVAARHVSDGHERAPSCKGCGWDSLTEDWIESWPCPDIAGLAGALGLEETA